MVKDDTNLECELYVEERGDFNFFWAPLEGESTETSVKALLLRPGHFFEISLT